jgi:hypothetical protein
MPQPVSNVSGEPTPEEPTWQLPASALGLDAQGASKVGLDDEPVSRRAAWLLPAAALAVGYHLAPVRRARPTGRARELSRFLASAHRRPDRFAPRFDLPESQQPARSTPDVRSVATGPYARVPGFM